MKPDTTPDDRRRGLLVIDDAATAHHWSETLAAVRVIGAATISSAVDLAVRCQTGELHVDFAFLELDLPDGDGGDLVPRLLQLPTNPGVIVTSHVLDADRVLRLHEAGCHLVLDKPVDSGTAQRALAFAEARRSVFHEVDDFARAHALSAGERDTLFWLAKGVPAGEIARIRRRSKSTIQTYIQRLVEKTGSSSTNGVIAQLLQYRHFSRLAEGRERRRSGIRWTDDDDSSDRRTLP